MGAASLLFSFFSKNYKVRHDLWEADKPVIANAGARKTLGGVVVLFDPSS